MRTLLIGLTLVSATCAAKAQSTYHNMMLELTRPAPDPVPSPDPDPPNTNTSEQRLNFVAAVMDWLATQGEIKPDSVECPLPEGVVAEVKSKPGGKGIIVTISKQWREKLKKILCNTTDVCVQNDAMISVMLHELIHAMQHKFNATLSETDAYTVQLRFVCELLKTPKYAPGTNARKAMEKFKKHVDNQARNNPN